MGPFNDARSSITRLFGGTGSSDRGGIGLLRCGNPPVDDSAAGIRINRCETYPGTLATAIARPVATYLAGRTNDYFYEVMQLPHAQPQTKVRDGYN